MRLLHVWDDHDGCFALAREPQAIRRRHLAFPGGQHLPLWDPSTYRGCDPKGGENHESSHEGVRPMTASSQISKFPLNPNATSLARRPRTASKLIGANFSNSLAPAF